MRIHSSLFMAGLALLLTTSGVAAQTPADAAGAVAPESGVSATGAPCGGWAEAGGGQARRTRARCGHHGEGAAGPAKTGCRHGQPGGGHGRAEMRTIWELIDGHEAIERRVTEIPGGVRTTTTADDPEMVAKLRRHAAEMAELIESGGRIRMWDPLFAELLSHSDELRMEVVEIDGGVVVTETSERPEVAELIRAHAAKVSEFVRRGREAYFESTPLPEGYSPK